MTLLGEDLTFKIELPHAWSKYRNCKRQRILAPYLLSLAAYTVRCRQSKLSTLDTVFLIALFKGTFYVVARLPVDTVEPAYDYLVREIGNQCGALVPDGVDRDAYYNTPYKEHKLHQRPFNCCSQTAVKGTGTTIELRPIPKEAIASMMFGPTPSKQKALRLDKNGSPNVTSLTSTKRMSDDTLATFESLFTGI